MLRQKWQKVPWPPKQGLVLIKRRNFFTSEEEQCLYEARLFWPFSTFGHFWPFLAALGNVFLFLSSLRVFGHLWLLLTAFATFVAFDDFWLPLVVFGCLCHSV